MFLRLSTTDAPLSSSSSSPLGFAGISNLFLKMRRLAHSQPQDSGTGPHCHPLAPLTNSASPAAQADHSLPTPPPTPMRARHPSEGTTTAYTSPPSSPVASRMSPSSSTSSGSPKPKSQHVRSSSGETPLSHPLVAEHACERREPIERIDTYHCTGGVSLPVLLRTTRADLMYIASVLGANALIEEQWKCTIHGPRNRNKLTYKVQIHYKAQATRSTHPDPHRPVALDQTQSIPGLMTVMRRDDD